MEEKDLFDLFREESDNLNETPPPAAWNRLEKRLSSTAKRKKKRKPLQLQLVLVVAIVALLLLLGFVSWFVARQHEDLLRGRREFAELKFLRGEWSSNDGKTTDLMTWKLRDSLTFITNKMLYYDGTLISNTSLSIKNQGKDNVFNFNNQNYELKEIKNNTFIFKAKNRSEIRLRKSTDDRFTISFGEGMVFVFKKKSK